MGCQIIYLNGPSSSGKSKLAKALQLELIVPHLHIGIDSLIAMMPAHVNDWLGGAADQGFSWKACHDAEERTIYKLNVGPYARKVADTYPKIVHLLAELGHFLIVDDVAQTDLEVDEWKRVLADFNVIYVGVKAPLEILEAREKARGDRIPGSSRAQFDRIHFDNRYDLVVDTSEHTLIDCARKIIQLSIKK